jgi:uncharacterized membrane protein YeaQ/YmgE (transglycosylase-associated protein family)
VRFPGNPACPPVRAIKMRMAVYHLDNFRSFPADSLGIEWHSDCFSSPSGPAALESSPPSRDAISDRGANMYFYGNDIIYILFVGLVAGFLAGKIMKGKGYGLVGDLVVGVLGSIVGWWLAAIMGIRGYGIITSILVALGGALLLLYIVRIVKKRN